jgi:hypothetical protein
VTIYIESGETLTQVNFDASARFEADGSTALVIDLTNCHNFIDLYSIVALLAIIHAAVEEDRPVKILMWSDQSVCEALALVRRDIVHPWQPECPINPGDKDETWLPIAGNHDWTVVLRDKRLRSRPGQRDALIAHGLRVFCLTGAGNFTKWEVLELLTRNWHTMEEMSQGPGPYVYSITSAGVRPLRLV